MKPSTRTIALSVFAVSLAVFSLARSRIFSLSAAGPDQARLLTGDEPSYLLLAHSIVTDGDVNLYNNCENKDDRHFGMERIGGHGARKDWEKREIYSIHTPGLPILIAPAYALGLIGPLSPRASVCLFMNLLAALLAVNVYLFCMEISGTTEAPSWPTLACTAAVMFTPPVVYYANLVYPELPAALFILYALRHAFMPDADTPHASRTQHLRPARHIRTLKGALQSVLGGKGALQSHAMPVLPSTVSPSRFAAALAVAFLPWLSFRFFLPAFVLLWLIVRPRRNELPSRRLAGSPLILLFAASLVLFFCYQHRAFGTFNPAAGYEYQKFEPGQIYKGLEAFSGILLDANYGILTWSPVYALSLTGLILILRENRRPGMALIILLAAIYLPGGLYMHWWGGYAPPPRYMVVPAPILGGLLCCALSRRPRASFVALFFLLFAASIVFGAIGCHHPSWLYRRRHLITNFYPLQPIIAIFPSFIAKTPSTWSLAAGWTAIILLVNGLILSRWPSGERGYEGPPGRM